MRVTICEAAAVNGDGTYSILRGGIDRYPDASFPFDLSICMLVEAIPSEVPTGTHAFCAWVKQSSRELAMLSGYAIAPTAEVMRFVIPIATRVPEPGVVEVGVKIGEVSARSSIAVGIARQN